MPYYRSPRRRKPTESERKRAERGILLFFLILALFIAGCIGAYIWVPALWGVLKIFLIIPIMGIGVLALAGGGSGGDPF